MEKKNKLILSILGVSAIVIPVALLIFTSSRSKAVPDVAQTNRSIDSKSISETVKKVVPAISPLPKPASTSASPRANPSVRPSEGSPSAR